MGDVVDVVIVGAGIAGASLGYQLAADRRVVLLEREDWPGYHSTGRSAAMLIASYGTDAVRALTRASRPFFEHPPEGFAAGPLLSPRAHLTIARADQLERLAAVEAETRAAVPSLQHLDRDGVLRVAPLVAPDYAAAGLFEPDSMAIDDAALHQGCLAGFQRRGGRLLTDAEVLKVHPTAGGGWGVETRAGVVEADVLVNAAGAWADQLAERAGVAPLGIQPFRRTAVLIDPPDGIDARSLPMIYDVAEQFYVKPEGAAFMVSPADQTPSEPTDAQPEELDVAIAVDRYETLTGTPVKKLGRRWAGLRSFSPDRELVLGFDPTAAGLFWLAGQGGFGIMTAPGAARLAAALIGGDPPDDDLGGLVDRLSPTRFRR
ncbi:MAG: FAD-binding oxidoreductase [Alphaproteobacteria bacterium]